MTGSEGEVLVKAVAWHPWKALSYIMGMSFTLQPPSCLGRRQYKMIGPWTHQAPT